ncbi:hypothetical protein AGMMS50293_21800 [Spirochaetia bacterium]|nr:hypothetical protein AGMMS50293_21800 [Spirochaetia bacterium]
MARGMSPLKIIGLVLLVAGVVVLVLGAYNLISFNMSTGGKFANKLAGAFGSRTKVVQNSIIQMAIGAVCAGVGYFLSKKG